MLQEIIKIHYYGVLEITLLWHITLSVSLFHLNPLFIQLIFILLVKFYQWILDPIWNAESSLDCNYCR